MMVGIDASRVNPAVKTGVEWYATDLIRALMRIEGAATSSVRLYAPNRLAYALPTLPSPWEERVLAFPPRYAWTQVRLSVEMLMHRPDVLFVPAYILPRVIPRRTIVTVHDVGFLRAPELYQGFNHLPWLKTRAAERLLRWGVEDVVARASHLITVSEFSKYEIMELCKVPEDRITVTYPGIDHERYAAVDATMAMQTRGRYALTRPYFLYIGRLEVKKNLTRLIQAFAEFKFRESRAQDIDLVLLGQPGMGYDEICAAMHASGCASSIRMLGYVPEDEKIAILSQALALVHPSLYEGFGFTPLEAMACGVSAIVSSAASLPEVVGEAHARWFDPENVESISAALMDEFNRPRSQEAREAARAWIRRYDWNKTAEKTWGVIRSES